MSNSARRRNQGDALYFVPGRKRPIITSTTATGHLLEAVSSLGLSIEDSRSEIHHDPDALAVLDAYIDRGYGDRLLSEVFA